MPPVRLSKSAERWFLNKVVELSEVNPAAARKLIERLERQKNLLSSFPQMTEKGVLEGTRKVSMPPLVLTIRARDGMVEIAAIRDELVRHLPQLNQGVCLGESPNPEPQNIVKPELAG